MGQLKQTIIMPFALLIFLFMIICNYLKSFFERIGNYLIDFALK